MKPDRDSEMKQCGISAFNSKELKKKNQFSQRTLDLLPLRVLRIQKGTWDKPHSVLLTLQARDILEKLFHQPHSHVGEPPACPALFKPLTLYG